MQKKKKLENPEFKSYDITVTDDDWMNMDEFKHMHMILGKEGDKIGCLYLGDVMSAGSQTGLRKWPITP
jgi:hypothetical protein